LKKIIESLHKSADDVSALLENLLIWARSQLNKIEYLPKEFKLSQIIHDSVKGLKQTANNKEQEIILDLDDQLMVLADSNMIQTVVRNLLSNALKFTQRGGQIVIKTEYGAMQTARISIADNGIGINKSALSQIFEVSNSFQRPGTENEKSTGLGLILVKDFVEKNNGTISIESEVGKGTVVTFTLPVA
jgi:signal transduction histidine kinase